MTMGRFTYHPRNPQPDISICEINFCAWVAQAAANDVLVYHRGFLAVDTDTPLAGHSLEEQRELRRLADAAFRAAEQGLIHLVQQRLARDRFAYLAIARPKPLSGRAATHVQLLSAA
jgi:hypothetical protein